MEIDEGIKVWLVKPNGSVHRTYSNPHQKRHPAFFGFYASRRVVAQPGRHTTLVVEIDSKFDLHSATGLYIAICIGGPCSQLDADDELYEQSFWLDKRDMTVHKEHRFSVLIVWEEKGAIEPSREVPLEMPQPSRKWGCYE